ncbi:lipoprotein signal peptidase [Tenacibaculum maritimum]|uniref:lipoprotein signal peptidase n=1 Tax=Tenacibaculum maritimum TaxID=107401 RepID=UPI0012E543BB|nr:lipoprotein signal peptidase [Tenacibaculum maritimum]MDB0600521.1 lipoprotein signal peptidase [Tenacibaculum maritimum]MDB0610674.1 lipoprotein signal peptidase [Tenacibaculum maritimum]CAA0165607.1 prolipoprotein signal peptidase (signal peptidase II) [Tenacibaculum maritimum]
MSKKNIAILTVVLAILIDQISKIYIKTTFILGEEVTVFSDWFKIHFTENNGMAWGFELGGKVGKLFLTLFRLVAVSGIVYWLWQTIQKKTHNGVIIAISLILAGAVGNIIDSVFYGVFFESSAHKVAGLLLEPDYSKLFYGKVVDMLYFPIYEGESFTFFNAIFNGADSWITIGVALLFIFNKQAFPKEEV